MMEIIQNIWTFLTTENDIITSFVVVPILGIIEACVSMLLFTSIFAPNSTRKQKLIYIAIVSVLGTVIRFTIPSPFGTYINLIMMFLSIKFIFKLSILKTIISLILPFVIAIFIELVISRLYTSIFAIDYVNGMNIPLHRLFGTMLMYLIMFLVYLTVKYLRINFDKYEILSKKKRVLMILNIIFGFILIGTQLYILTYYTYSLPSFILILNIISITIYISISFYTIFTVSKLEKTSTNLEEAQLYNKTLEILQDNTRAFRHDFANILQGMVGYMDNDDMEGLKKYYSQLVDDIQTSNNLTTLSPKVVNNPAIYNVLASKYHKADSLGIKIHLEAFLDMNELHMKIYEFTRVLGILMDNAIEASSECENKVINVTFRNDNRRHIQLVIIENTYKNKDVDTDKIFEKGYSTKKGNTGLGLWEIRQILKKNNNLNLYTTKNKDMFTQQFEIYY